MSTGLELGQVKQTWHLRDHVSLFPFLETRGEHILCSRTTLNSWKHDAAGKAEAERLGDLRVCEANSELLPPAEEEGAFERSEALMGRWRLTRWGQLQVGEVHHVRQRGTEEERSQ